MSKNEDDKIMEALPRPLVDFIWQLALSEGYGDYAQQIFQLHGCSMGGLACTEVVHTCPDTTTWHRVREVEAPACTLFITNKDEQYNMSIRYPQAYAV